MTTIEQKLDQAALLLRGIDLMNEALEDHIFDENNKPIRRNETTPWGEWVADATGAVLNLFYIKEIEILRKMLCSGGYGFKYDLSDNTWSLFKNDEPLNLLFVCQDRALVLIRGAAMLKPGNGEIVGEKPLTRIYPELDIGETYCDPDLAGDFMEAIEESGVSPYAYGDSVFGNLWQIVRALHVGFTHEITDYSQWRELRLFISAVSSPSVAFDFKLINNYVEYTGEL